jgi:hypothetical protein
MSRAAQRKELVESQRDRPYPKATTDLAMTTSGRASVCFPENKELVLDVLQGS